MSIQKPCKTTMDSSLIIFFEKKLLEWKNCSNFAPIIYNAHIYEKIDLDYRHSGYTCRLPNENNHPHD